MKKPPSTFHKWRPHPWHGLSIGPNPPTELNAYIELTPFDLVKYEIDKETGYIAVDRPQLTSSIPPSLYGFIPKTYCGERVGRLMKGSEKRGDGDPLDICVVSERPISRVEVIVRAKVLGGLPMLDDGEADDKIIAVLASESVWNGVEDVGQLPSVIVDRIRHYFTTYKLHSDSTTTTEIGETYGREHAFEVIRAAIEDYEENFGGEGE